MRKFLLKIMLIILVGVLFANYIYDKYKTDYVMVDNKDAIYFLQEGVYIDKSSIHNITVPYITVKSNQKYYTYLGMTLDLDVANKIKEIYEKQNINVYIKPVLIDNVEFLSQVSQYDILLKETDNYGELSSILNTILSTYEEIINVTN